MKCDELIPTEIYARFAEEVYDDFGDSPQEQEYYRKEHADAAIAELKDKIKIYEDLGSCKKGCPALRHNQRRVTGEIYKVTLKDKEIAELKQKLEDAGMENRKLKRALWMHRAITAKFNKEACKAMREYNPFIGIEEYKWQEAERKCKAKAEEYK